MAELAKLLQAGIRKNPSAVFHRLGDSVITYAELDRGSAAIAAFLGAHAPRGEPVLLVGSREHEMLIAMFGCIRAGNPYVPAGELIPPQRSVEMAASAGCRIALIAENATAWVGRSPALEARPVRDILREPAAGPEPGWDRCAHGEELVYILFTSGSTGSPKGVKVSAGNIESFLAWTGQAFGYPERPAAFLNQAPFHFDLSVYEVYNAATTGGSLLSVPGSVARHPEELFRLLYSYGENVEVWVSTPSFLRYCVSHSGFTAAAFPRLRQFVLIGEIFTVPLAAEAQRRFPSAALLNFYGPTEATVAHTVFEVTEESLRQYPELPVGRVKPGGKVLLENGEIVLAGDNVAWGYVNAPEATERKFVSVDGERRYRTGDLGSIDGDGLLFFRGRVDMQVKINGFRVELGEVERELGLIPGITACCVMLDGSDGTAWIAAFVQMAGGLEETEIEFRKRLKHALGERLPAYMIPKRFIRVAEMPMNRNGKIDRDQLRSQL